MEKLCKHIEKLLAQHDYVVVPDLGGFVVQMQSAQILTDSITPPLATIAFNPLMHHADGLLAIEIARSEQISYRLAMKYINKKVQQFRQTLKTQESCQFGNLGIFQQNETGSLVFNPLENADFLPMNFQLSSIQTQPKSVPTTENNKKITITLHSNRLFKYAAAVLIAIGLFAISPKVSDTRQSNTAGFVPTSLIARQKIIQQPTPSTLKQKADSSISIAKDSVKPTTSKTVTKAENHFYIIVASLSTKESADKYCKELATKEFKNSQVLPPAKTYRIAIQSFSDKDEAIEYMEKLRETDSRFETAWVLCN